MEQYVLSKILAQDADDSFTANIAQMNWIQIGEKIGLSSQEMTVTTSFATRAVSHHALSSIRVFEVKMPTTKVGIAMLVIVLITSAYICYITSDIFFLSY